MEADLILRKGIVLTMNPAKPIAEAIAIKNGRIIEVGGEAEVIKYRGVNTKVIDLMGKTVVPGFIDTHVHLLDFAKVLAWIDLSDATSIEEIKNKVRLKAQGIPKGRWILGRGWHEKRLREKRPPKAMDLDEVAPENPVVLYRSEGRVCVANSMALMLAGINSETKSPHGGEICRDSSGNPNGVLIESATNLVWKIIPEQSLEEILENIDVAFQKIIENGITSIHWIISSPSEKKIVSWLAKRGRLPVRIKLIVPEPMLEDFIEIRNLCNDINLGGAIIFADGSLAAGTAALSSPYMDQPENMGSLFYTRKALADAITKIHRAGLQLVVHAMGDKAVEEALMAIKEALPLPFKPNHRHRIENAAVLNRELIEQMKSLGVVISLQPYLIFSEFAIWSAINRLGYERARWLYPLRTLINNGIIVAAGSDCPMEPLNPFVQMKAAVARSFFPEERVTIEEALRMFTINAAYISFEEDMKGSIEGGKLADLTVLSGNPMDTPPEKLDNIKVEMTIVGGRIVYQAYNK